MSLRPGTWQAETLVCATRGHLAPAAHSASVGPHGATIGIDESDGTRLVRCLRCDLWLRITPPTPGDARWPEVPPVDELHLPVRGRALRDRLVLRLIALERSIHVLVFGLLAFAALVVQLKLPAMQGWAARLVTELQAGVARSARGESHSWLVDELQRLANLSPGTLWAVVGVSAAYAVLEAFETIGLWRGRRWGEYLTVAATAGFLPFELIELSDGASPLKLTVLGLNVVILVYLVWAKRLFGLRGGSDAAGHPTNWAAVFADPLTPDAGQRLASDQDESKEDL
jgi:uncharacterized membrane protein (DUF2068 family)